MAVLVARVAGFAFFWFGTIGLANGVDQIREHPYWFFSPWDRLAYVASLFAAYGGVGLPFGIVAGICCGLILRGKPGAGRGTESAIALAVALLCFAGLRIHSDIVVRAVSWGGILANLAPLSAAMALFLFLIIGRRRDWFRAWSLIQGAAGVLVLAGVGYATGHGGFDTRAGHGRPNILLIVIDTLRADRLSCYGNPRPVSPTIDRIAREGILFTDAVAPAPLTQPSVSTLLTGLYPRTSGVLNHPSSLPESCSTLPELLRVAGYRTAFVNSHPLLTPACGFGQGWTEYRFVSKPYRFQATLLAGLLRRLGLIRFAAGERADSITDGAIRFLREKNRRPFFIYAHYTDPHFPYTPPSPFGRIFSRGERPPLLDARLPDGRRDIFDVEAHPKAIRETIDLYDGEIAFADCEIGRLVAALEERGLLENTVVVLTADHGESLGEHGLYFAHTHYLYDSTQRVPLMVRWPRLLPSGRLIEGPTSLVHLAPTLLEIAGVERPSEMEGRGLLSLLRGETRAIDHSPAFSQNGRTVLNNGEEDNPRWRVEGDAGRWSTIRVGEWKVIHIPTPTDPRYELYHLLDDPREGRNLAGERPDVLSQFSRSLEEWLERPGEKNASRPAVDEETLEGLRALGYVR